MKVSNVSDSRFQNGIYVGPFDKNPNRKKGKNGKRPLEFLDLSLYPWKFQTKLNFIPGNSTKLCYIHWNFRSKTKNQDPWKFHTMFFWINFWNSTSFFIVSCNFHILFFNNPGTSMSSKYFGYCHYQLIYSIYIANKVIGTATIDSW